MKSLFIIIGTLIMTKKKVKTYCILYVFFPALLFANNFWQPLEKIKCKSINSIVIDDSGHIFIGSLDEGLYRSDDHGQNWINTYTGYQVFDIFSRNNRTIFIGTNDGILRSDNNGDTWSATHWENVRPWFSKAFLTNGSGDLLAGTSGGIFRYDEDQNTWSQIVSTSDYYITSICMNTTDFIFAGTFEISTNNQGILYSVDNGNTWIFKENMFSDLKIYTIAANDSDHIFIGTQNGIFKSRDNGDNWLLLGNELIRNKVKDITIQQNGNIYISTVNGIYHSADNGKMWNSMNDQFTDLDFASIANDNDGGLWAGSVSNGLYHTTDNGRQWNSYKIDFIDIHLSTIAMNQNKDIYVGSLNYGIFRSYDEGNSWEAINIGLKSKFIKKIVVNNFGQLFASANDSTLYRSDNNGDSWEKINNSLGDNWNYISQISFNDLGHIFLTNNGNLFLSTDDGQNWNKSNLEYYINAFTISQNNDIIVGIEDIYDGIYQHEILRSANNGVNWTSISSGIDSTYKISIIKADDYSNLYAYGYYFYLAQDNEFIWEKAEMNGLFNSSGFSPHVRDFIIDTDRNIYAATTYGIFWSNDYGENWETMNEGLPEIASKTISLKSLVYDKEEYIYVIPEGKYSVFRNSIPLNIDLSDKAVAKNFKLYQNYPNPFNPKTIISYQLSVISDVELSVFNLIGQRIATLVLGRQPAGYYEVEWDAAGISSGVYFYRIKAGEFTETKKFILQK